MLSHLHIRTQVGSSRIPIIHRSEMLTLPSMLCVKAKKLPYSLTIAHTFFPFPISHTVLQIWKFRRRTAGEAAARKFRKKSRRGAPVLSASAGVDRSFLGGKSRNLKWGHCPRCHYGTASTAWYRNVFQRCWSLQTPSCDLDCGENEVLFILLKDSSCLCTMTCLYLWRGRVGGFNVCTASWI